MILTYLQAYADNSIIPESQVQLLGPASRVATVDDINMWSITEIDTLSALMDSSNGQWDPSLVSKQVNKRSVLRMYGYMLVCSHELMFSRLRPSSLSIWVRQGTNWAVLSSTPSGDPTCAPWTPTFWGTFPNRASSKKSGPCVCLEDCYTSIMTSESKQFNWPFKYGRCNGVGLVSKWRLRLSQRSSKTNPWNYVNADSYFYINLAHNKLGYNWLLCFHNNGSKAKN